MRTPVMRILCLLTVALVGACASPKPGLPDPADTVRSEQSYRAEVAENPNNADAHLKLAEVLAHSGGFDEAMAHFTTAESLGQTRKSLELRQELAREYGSRAETVFDSGDAEGARRLMNQSMILDPQVERSDYLLGRLAEVEGNHAQALQHFRNAYGKSPGNKAYSGAYADALVIQARDAVRGGDHAMAVEYLNQARPLLDDAEVSYLMGSVTYAWAERAADPAKKRELLYQAVESFRRVLRSNPNDQDARYNLAAVLIELEDYEGAASIYSDLAAQNPRDGELYQALSMVHSRLGMSALALAENAVGRALRADEPVQDVSAWARRSAGRFSGSDLSATYNRYSAPEEILTYTSTGGKLDEVWFYWVDGLIFAFREGGTIGAPVVIRRP